MKKKEPQERQNEAAQCRVQRLRNGGAVPYSRKEGKVIEMKQWQEERQEKTSKNRWRFFAAAVAALLLIGGVAAYAQSNAVDSIVEIDVNPGIQLSINRKEKVLAAEAMDEEAKLVLGDMKLAGTDLDVAVNALIGSLLKNGYITDQQNSILISVEHDDEQRGKELENRLVSEVNSLLSASSIEAAILSQQLTEDQQAAQLVEEYGISEGKAALIRQLMQTNALLSAEELKDLNINELNLLASSQHLEGSALSSTGRVSDKAYIGEGRAKAITLEDAGIKESDIRSMKIEMDIEHGAMVYEVEFSAGAKEYDYEIDALTGSIVKRSSKDDDDWIALHGSQESSTVQDGTPLQGGTSSAESGGAGSASAGTGRNYIGTEKAKAIALAHAGVAESEARKMQVELDEDDGRWEYEIEFEAGVMEYEYEIDALTGQILKAESDIDD